MIYDILEQKLIDAGLGVAGQSLFRGDMGPEIKIGIMVREPLTGVRIDPYIPGYHKPLLQVIVRHTDPVAGNTLAQAVSDTLTITGVEDYAANSERGKAQLKVFFPREIPIRYPRSPGNTIEWSINFITAFAFLSA